METEEYSNIVHQARHAALLIMPRTIRAVLQEAASQTLQRILCERLTELPIDTATPREIHVRQTDIDVAYNAACIIGENWERKLKEVGEDDLASVVLAVMKTGRFLELNIVDDVEHLQGGGEDIHVSSDSNPTTVPQQVSTNDHTTVEDRRITDSLPVVHGFQEKNMSTMGMLKSLGLQYVCSIGTSTESRGESMTVNDITRTSTESHVDSQTAENKTWHPLPSFSNTSSSLVHIPKATLLPSNLLKSQSTDELYGVPPTSLLCQYGTHTTPFPFISTHQFDSFIRGQIDRIDDYFGSADRKGEHTNWYHGWDVIQRAVERNQKRIYLETLSGRKRKRSGDRRKKANCDTEDVYEIVPKSSMANRESTTSMVASSLPQLPENQVGGVVDETNVGDNEVIDAIHDVVIVPAVDFIASRISGTASHGSNQLELALPGMTHWHNPVVSTQVTLERQGRSPSSFHSATWNRDDIMGALSSHDRMYLETTMIHGILEEEHTAECRFNQVQGGLKYIGSIQLWEQVRVDENYGYCKASLEGEGIETDVNESNRKNNKALRKAKRHRLWPHGTDTDYKEGTIRQLSKILWSESTRSEHQGTLNHIPTITQAGKHWMEIDLGECFVTHFGHSGRKELLAFRSLECSIAVD